MIPVILTELKDNRQIRRPCYLLEDDDPMAGRMQEDGTREMVDNPEYKHVLARQGLVLFQDDKGLFTLYPEAIVEIEVVE